ncbi:hypothetical protein [Altericroceibacterium indicum]|nr:hypothetical protein [Altericroceibacterium indicum]
MPRKSQNFNPMADWLQLGASGMQLWSDACSVIALRTIRMAQGGKTAEREAQLMVDEKIDANMSLAMKLAMAGPSSPEATMRRAVQHYSKPVKANRRRLMKG